MIPLMADASSETQSHHPAPFPDQTRAAKGSFYSQM